jgi:hypothetical protein
MSEIGDRLRQSDPMAGDTGLSMDDCARMRREILEARPRVVRRRARFVAPLALLVCVGAGSVWMVQTLRPNPVDRVVPAPHRQLQFSTAGGTRVIWFFNPDLEVK